MYMIRRAKLVIITSTLVSVIAWSGFFELQRITARAQFEFFLIPFGGPIANVEVCTCSETLNVMIVDYAKIPILPVNYLFVPGQSILWPWFQIFRSGPWTLGQYTPGAECLIAQKYCTPATIPPIGTIFQVGTSL